MTIQIWKTLIYANRRETEGMKDILFTMAVYKTVSVIIILSALANLL
jgi:hypothetical protein